MKLFFCTFFVSNTLSPLFADANVEARDKECVVLLHGLARTSNSMNALSKSLERSGYLVANINYPSRKKTISELAQYAVGKGVAECQVKNAASIHFVTHSMGGILVRHYLTHHQIKNFGRVVMLAPPNQGSEIVDNWKNIPGFFWLNGLAGMQLGTDAASVPLQLGPVDYSVGIIAGTKSLNPILSLSLPNPDDGKVSLQSAKVDGMKDCISLPVSHTFIMRKSEVIKQVKNFLQFGVFYHKRNGDDNCKGKTSDS